MDSQKVTSLTYKIQMPIGLLQVGDKGGVCVSLQEAKASVSAMCASQLQISSLPAFHCYIISLV